MSQADELHAHCFHTVRIVPPAIRMADARGAGWRAEPGKDFRRSNGVEKLRQEGKAEVLEAGLPPG